MVTLLAFHEVDDVDHWVRSSKREEFFGPHGLTSRVFVDPEGSHRVGLIIETPSLEKLQELLATPEAADAMKHDGVRPETLLLLRAP